MTTSKTESKPKRVLKMVPCVESKLNVRPAAKPVPKRTAKAKSQAGSVPVDPEYLKPNVLQMMTWKQAQALAKHINDHWDEPAFVSATAENAGNHGIVVLSIVIYIHGVRLKPVKTTLHFAPLMTHVLDMVSLAYHTAAEAVAQTRVHAAEAVKWDFLQTLNQYEQG